MLRFGCTWKKIQIGNLAGFGFAVCLSAPTFGMDPPAKSLLNLTTEQTEQPLEIGLPADSSNRFVLDSDPHLPEMEVANDGVETETIRERFPNGTVRIERQVALDAEGNYVKHGSYQEWNDKGQPVIIGQYVQGKREGHWLQFIYKPVSGILTAMPYNEFEPPFTSDAEFKDNKLQGTWKIADAKGRIASIIDFEDGLRSGAANWYFVNGKPYFESHYSKGLLDGDASEFAKDGSRKRQDVYNLGQRLEVKREYFPDKRPRTEFEYLTPKQSLVSQDDWANLKMALYEPEGDIVKHGPFTVWHENGQVHSKGQYKMGELDGEFQSWHPTGDRESAGKFVGGKMQGMWCWWHPNGMKLATGNYAEGNREGNWRAWDSEGMLVKKDVFDNSELAVPTPDAAPQVRTVRKLYDLIR
jgi:antitoxin component YwqK of YwqJK toxin-antitoxin module